MIATLAAILLAGVGWQSMPTHDDLVVFTDQGDRPYGVARSVSAECRGNGTLVVRIEQRGRNTSTVDLQWTRGGIDPQIAATIKAAATGSWVDAVDVSGCHDLRGKPAFRVSLLLSHGIGAFRKADFLLVPHEPIGKLMLEDRSVSPAG